MRLRWSRRSFLGSAIAAHAFRASAGAAACPRVIGSRTGIKDAVRTQVLVVGAGASGVPAALAAARAGAKVILLEEDSIPGGAPVDMYVTVPCGGPIVGLYAEMLARLQRDFRLTGQPPSTSRLGPILMPSAYVQTIYSMIWAEPNLKLCCSAPVLDVIVSEGTANRLRGVVIQRADGRQETIEADVVIDATGLGAIAARAGCECRYGTDAKGDFNEPIGPEKSSNQVQDCTLMLVTQRLRPEAKIDPTMLKGSCLADGGNAALSWAATVSCRDTCNPSAVANSQEEALRMIEPEVAYLYKQGYAAHIAPKLGVRETRRVIGDHVFTVNDMLRAKRPDDAIAVGTYGLDCWGDKYGRSNLPGSLTPGGYGIPLGTLLTKGMDNLMVVGKSLSATHLAASAVRVQCIVAQMGQAAGTIAALAALNRTTLRSVPAREIQARLRAGGIPLETVSQLKTRLPRPGNSWSMTSYEIGSRKLKQA